MSLKKHQLIVISVVAVALVGYASYSFYTSSSEQYESAIIMDDNLIAYEVTIGAGEEAKKGNTVSVNYVGALAEGTVFDSSYDRGEPFSFTIGAGEVIKGWEKGLIGMKVGGKRRLAIPPQLAYGAQGVPGLIPPNALLLFEIELLAIE